MTYVDELDVAARARLRWLVAKQAAASRDVSSWDLLGFDGDGHVLFVDYFHLATTFVESGTRTVEAFADLQRLNLVGAWERSRKPGIWVIRASAATVPVPDDELHVHPRRRLWRAFHRARPDTIPGLEQEDT